MSRFSDLCAFTSRRHYEFAEAFVRLWRQKRAEGIERPRVGRLAALAAGYGEGSWCATNAIQTADQMVNRLLKRPEVLARIQQLGLERVNGEWREARQPA